MQVRQGKNRKQISREKTAEGNFESPQVSYVGRPRWPSTPPLPAHKDAYRSRNATSRVDAVIPGKKERAGSSKLDSYLNDENLPELE